MSVVNRERRKNAGKRMAILGKKMAEEDDAFWSHDTWADDDSGNESFHESDEDSALQKDVFDSDFNDSESDNEDEEVAAGEAEERELRKSERAAKSNNNAYKQPGGHKRRRGFPGVGKRVLGEGFNVGIVLNLPPESHDSLAYLELIAERQRAYLESLQTQQSTPIQPATPTITTDTKTTPTLNNSLAPPIAPPLPLPPRTKVTIKSKAKVLKPVPERKQTRASKASLKAQGVRKLRGRGEPITPVAPTRKAAAAASGSDTTARAKRKRFAQEELLLEAVHDTEPENQRWLHGRKRVQDQHNLDKDSNAGLRDRYRGKKVVQKFHSRRGCLITLTFPEMDAVPEILTRRQEPTKQPQPHNPPIAGVKQETSTLPTPVNPQQQQQPPPGRCVISGKAGKYKDPLTKYSYHDLAAFKELRRRHKAGIAIVTRPVVTKSAGSEGATTKKAPGNAARTAPAKKKTTKVAKKKPAAANAGTIKNARTVKQEAKMPSSVNPIPKLPFQSPKPPSRPSTNGGNTHPSSTNVTATNPQQSAVVDKLGFNWGAKPGATTNAKGTTSPASPRRLSPRKWKPSEKVLETISTDGSAPRGLTIQAQLPPAPSLTSQPIPDSSTSKPAIGQVVTIPAATASLAPKSLPPEKPLSSTIKGTIPEAPAPAIKPPANGGSKSATNTANTLSAKPSATGTNGNSKEKLAQDKSPADAIVQPKVDQSAPNGNTKNGATFDRTTIAIPSGQNAEIKDKPKPIQ